MADPQQIILLMKVNMHPLDFLNDILYSDEYQPIEYYDDLREALEQLFWAFQQYANAHGDTLQPPGQ